MPLVHRLDRDSEIGRVLAAQGGDHLKAPSVNACVTAGASGSAGESTALLLVSRFSREPWSLPSRGSTWLAIPLLVFLGSAVSSASTCSC
jgi:hypothetical protein